MQTYRNPYSSLVKGIVHVFLPFRWLHAHGVVRVRLSTQRLAHEIHLRWVFDVLWGMTTSTNHPLSRFGLLVVDFLLPCLSAFPLDACCIHTSVEKKPREIKEEAKEGPANERPRGGGGVRQHARMGMEQRAPTSLPTRSVSVN